jgi:hypothetical protein
MLKEKEKKQIREIFPQNLKGLKEHRSFQTLQALHLFRKTDT